MEKEYKYKGYTVEVNIDKDYPEDTYFSVFDSIGENRDGGAGSINEAKKMIDSWINDGYASIGKIRNVRKYKDNYLFEVDLGNEKGYGIYETNTGAYTTFDAKPGPEMVARFNLDEIEKDKEANAFYRDHTITDVYNNGEDGSLKYVLSSVATKEKALKPKAVKLSQPKMTNAKLSKMSRGL